jgi:hypothetical protein
MGLSAFGCKDCAFRFAVTTCRLQFSRRARASTVFSEIPILRASSRNPRPEANAVFACSQVSTVARQPEQIAAPCRESLIIEQAIGARSGPKKISENKSRHRSGWEGLMKIYLSPPNISDPFLGGSSRSCFGAPVNRRSRSHAKNRRKSCRLLAR